jgi:hypothetical protein
MLRERQRSENVAALILSGEEFEEHQNREQ